MSIRVLIMRPDRAEGYDVTDRVDGLSWSNVNPGGHERCTFTLKGDWGGGFPEVARGNIVRVEDGMGELFTGRIDEQDPQLADAEQVSVTAYGLGVRLKDNTMREIYVDSDMTHWVGPSVGRRLTLTTAGYGVQEHSVAPDAATGAPSMVLNISGAWLLTSMPMITPMYDAQGLELLGVEFAWKFDTHTVSAADANWGFVVLGMTDDIYTIYEASTDLASSSSGYASKLFGFDGHPKTFAALEFYYGGGPAGANNTNFPLYITSLAVFGTAPLDQQGTHDETTTHGYFASQIVGDVCRRLNDQGIVARRIDESDYIITQLVFLTDVAHEDVITEVSKYHEADWGVWGADLLLGAGDIDPTVGYLDWTARDSTVPTWTAWREECDEVDLHTEIGSTYNQVAVKYTDVTGNQHRVLRTIASPALEEAQIGHRTATLDGGTLDQNGAEQLGDAFLLLSNGEPVSRGQAIITQPIERLGVGLLPAHHMRADGSNLYIPDAFPDRDTLALEQSADRRSIFPVKRVTVDCSGDVPKVTAELDQTHDLLSILLARLQLGVGQALGSGG